jgi:peptidoglycan/LPS O-acetylase OafA/YrhL
MFARSHKHLNNDELLMTDPQASPQAQLPEPQSTADSRLIQIDGLRAIAALSVVAFHYTTRFDQLFLHVAPTRVEFPYGYLGVNLFFAISGFVIFMTLDRIRAPLDFVISRFSRLFPSYWAAVAITWLLVSVVGLPAYEVSWKSAVFNLTMLQSFFSVPDVDGVYWSLQIELLFYIWMLILWVTGALRFSVGICAGWLTIAILATMAERIVNIRAPYAVSYFLLLDWIPWFAMGMTVFLTLKEQAFKAKHAVVLLLALLAIAVKNQMPTLIAAPLTFALLFAASRNRIYWLAWRPLVFFGVISYPLYLVHEKIGWLIILKGEAVLPWPWLSIALAFMCSVSLAIILHKFIEGPGSKAIRALYKNSVAAISARNFSRARWAGSAITAILVFTTGYVVTARAQKANEQPRFSMVLNQALPTNRIPCVSADGLSRTRMLIVLGQSNAASHATLAPDAKTTRVFFQGSCSESTDPMPGTTGSGASIWSAVSNQLSVTLPEMSVVIAPLAVGNTHISDWLVKGKLYSHLQQHLEYAQKSQIPVVAVLWQQGEADSIDGTAANKYKADLLALRSVLNTAGIVAPLLVAKSTYCAHNDYGPIRRAIDAVVHSNQGIRPGPDTDRLREEFRKDGCHFNAAGRLAAAELWTSEIALLLKNEQPKTGTIMP